MALHTDFCATESILQVSLFTTAPPERPNPHGAAQSRSKASHLSRPVYDTLDDSDRRTDAAQRSGCISDLTYLIVAVVLAEARAECVRRMGR